MDSLVWVALAVPVGSFAGPVVLAMINARHRRRERAEDFARQDAAAEKAEMVARKATEDRRLIAGTQQVAIAATKQVAKVAAVAAADTKSQLKQIHSLVNSNLTAARQAELDQTRLTLAVLNRIVAMDRDAGREATEDDLAAIGAAEAHVAELMAILADRMLQLREVEAEAAAAAAAKSEGK